MALTDAVIYCHKQGVVHRDIKLENLLSSAVGKKKTIKLTDFGLSKILAEGEKATQ